MTTIEKIRAEIERRITDNTFGAKLELMDILSFLDTLEEPVGKTCKTCGFYENNCPFIRGKFISYPNKVCKDYTFSTLKAEQEPVSEDLEEELERRYEQAKWGYVDGFGETVMDKEQFTRIARHFAQWGAEHYRDSTKKMSKDLEEAADEYSGDSNTGFIDMTSYRAFIAGAEWMKKQIPMPEDTVIFQKGVEEGRRLEREDALTIADIEKLHTFLYAVKNNKQGAFTFTRLSDEQYEEVLRRFNKTKEQ